MGRVRIAAEVLTTYARVRLLLRSRDIAAVVAALRARPEGTLDARETRIAARRLTRPVQRTLEATPWDARCLMRSLVLLRMLDRRGAAATLVIGAGAGKGFAAHAWLERDGRPLTDTLGHEPLARL